MRQSQILVGCLSSGNIITVYLIIFLICINRGIYLITAELLVLSCFRIDEFKNTNFEIMILEAKNTYVFLFIICSNAVVL